jgi:threonine/homoserine/homoserine lactone efflux protein
VVGELVAFLGISALVIVTPGQDTALTIRNTLLGGRRGGLLTALGVSSGQAVWTLATSAGLAALLVAWEPVYEAIKLAGAAYLVLLGAQALKEAMKPDRAAKGLGNTLLQSPRLPAYRQGLLSNLGNPKMAVFFTSLLPQFAPEGGASFLGLIALGFMFSLLTLAWLGGYAIAVAKAGDVLRRPDVRRVLDAVTGTVLVALGIRLATERR